MGFSGGEIHSEAYSRYVICQRMGWDFYTYLKQPQSFLEEILIIMKQEAENEKRENKKLEQK